MSKFKPGDRVRFVRKDADARCRVPIGATGTIEVVDVLVVKLNSFTDAIFDKPTNIVRLDVAVNYNNTLYAADEHLEPIIPLGDHVFDFSQEEIEDAVLA